MARLQSIENALLEINEVVFQELCDAFLSLRNKNYIAFSRTGSQSGKQKSTKGTPDSFKLLPNGMYIFVEHTTVSKSQKSKLEKDIEKCIDEDKTKIPIDDIIEIVLCTNFNLNTEEIDHLKNKIAGLNIGLDIYTLDRLSIELLHQHPNLCHQYLGIVLDTGQIVSVSQFIQEYNKAAKNIATPLDNLFLHRDTEIEQLCEAITNSDFIIITGSPGVGKTKLALEGINTFLSNNHDYNAFCVSYKSAKLLEDLYQNIDPNLDYLLLVDDANRIDSFNQIIGFYRSKRSGKLKIVITVRDYAFSEIAQRCYEFTPSKLHLNKLTDNQIIDIIKSDSFKIINSDFQREIVRIADGNPRLAIMAAKLAIEKQNLYALSDVSDLFEEYFSRFISDNVDFVKPQNLKSLGLIAFFYTIPYKDKQRCSKILEKFDLEYNIFIESIDLLNTLEMVDLLYDYVKIPEQNLSTFFFYKAFIKDDILSFNVLLNSYYYSNIDRFRDTIIPANNTFGYNNVLEKVKPILLSHLQSIKMNKEKVFDLLSVFWAYLIEETLDFLYTLINEIPEPTNPKYPDTYELIQANNIKDNVIKLLSHFFNTLDNLSDALELSFEYSRKVPNTLPELIYSIKDSLLFDSDDQRIEYKRQEIFINLLLEKSQKGENIYKISFPALATSLLQYKFHHTKGGRNHSFYWYDYPFPLTDITKQLRENIWEKIDRDFQDNSEIFFWILTEYSKQSLDGVKEVMAFDVPLILKIIHSHFNNNHFEHCHYVQEQIRWYIKNDIHNKEFDILINTFVNETYIIYLKINWDRHRDKDNYEYEDFSEYERLKENEVRENFIFEHIDKFIEFYNHYKYIFEWEKNRFKITKSLDILIDENIKNNFELGVNIFEYIISQNNETQYIPHLTFQNFSSNKDYAQLLWDTISNKVFYQSVSWQLRYFYYLDKEITNAEQHTNLLSTINKIEEPTFIYFKDLEKFLKIDEKSFLTILKIIVDKIRTKNIDIQITRNFFSEYMEYIKSDIRLVKEAYIQQDELQQSYDYGGKDLLAILKIDKNFIMENIEHLISTDERHRSHDYKSFSVVWLLDNIEEDLIKVFDYIADNETYLGILDHFCNSFFFQISKEESKNKSDQFVINYIDANYNNTKRMNMIVDVLRHTKKDLFKEAFLHFLNLTQDEKLFSQIWWIGNGGSTTGNESLGERMAGDWRQILNLTNKSNLGIKIIPIKKYINYEIEAALDYAENERMRRFLERF